MSLDGSFDFSRYNYTFDQNTGKIEAVPKKSGPHRSAKETLRELEICQKNIETHWKEETISPEIISKLKAFSFQLEAYLEQQIRKKHPYLGGIMILFQKNFSGATLASLTKLEMKFDQLSRTMQRAKERVSNQDQLVKALLTRPKHLDKQVHRLISELPNYDWIRDFADAKPSSERVEEVYKALKGEPQVTKITSRFEEIKNLNRGEHNLEPYQMLKIAYFIEMHLLKPPMKDLPGYIKKSGHNLARSLIYDSSTQEVYILSKKKVAILTAEGTSKKVTSAIVLASQRPVEIAAQSVSKGKLNAEDLEEIRTEMKRHVELKGLPGIWPIYHWCNYTKVIGKNKIEKVTAVMKKGDGDLNDFLPSLNKKEVLSVSYQLIQGLQAMHARNLVHGDLKLLNALLKRENGKIVAGLIDFGFTFDVKKDKPTFIFDEGYYGSIRFTPPEVFGKLPFRGDYKKTDVWALGYMLYQLKFKKEPPWQPMLDDCYKNHLIVTREKSRTFAEMIANKIEEPLAKLPKKNLTQDQRFEKLIYNMMRLDPEKRYSMNQALEEMQRLIAF